jgi:hypothetical protein
LGLGTPGVAIMSAAGKPSADLHYHEKRTGYSNTCTCAWCGEDFDLHEEPKLRLVVLLAADGTPLHPRLLHVHKHCAPALDPWRGHSA